MPSNLRYRLYREHKYLIFRLSEVERQIAKTDFRSNVEVNTLVQQLNDLKDLLEGHAEHEDTAIHPLLERKNSDVHTRIEAEHRQHEIQFKDFNQQLQDILAANNKDKRLSLVQDFYLAYRLFVSENLQHLHWEETVIMSELQKLYTDEELQKIDANTYSHMTPEEIIEMLDVLLPHMDANDKEFFLNDIKKAAPEKYAAISLAYHH